MAKEEMDSGVGAGEGGKTGGGEVYVCRGGVRGRYIDRTRRRAEGEV